MLHEDMLYLLLPGFMHGETVEFREYRGACAVRVLDRYTLEIEGDFPDALVRFDVELKPGKLDYTTLYNQLSEHPSGEFVDVGPLDLGFPAPPRMQIPMLAVSQDGDLFGKMWFEMPSVEDVRQRKLGGVFVLEFPGGGHHRVTIAVDEIDRDRLDLTMFERITVRLDSRRLSTIAPQPGWTPEAPWLFLGGRSVEDLRGWRATTHQTLWDDLRRTVDTWLETGDIPFRGMPVLSTAAFTALLDETGGYSARLIALLEDRRARDAFLERQGKLMFLDTNETLFAEKNRWLMGHGWNDYGFAWILLDYCCVYQWLGDQLPTELKAWIREKLRYYGRELYRFCLFQRQYSGAQGFYEAHQSVPQLTVAVLGAIFYREDAEAPRWLRFAVGRIEEALEIAPRDGKADYMSWGTVWFSQSTELLHDLAGRDEWQHPYFQHLPTALWRTHYVRSVVDHQEIADYYRSVLTAFCATHLHDPVACWYYHFHRDTARPGDVTPVSYLHYLWHTEEAGTPPGPEQEASYLLPDTSQALLQTNYHSPRFALRMQCGPTLGKASSYKLESYANAAAGSTFAYGGFEALVNGWPVITDIATMGYGRYFRNANALCVDSDGFFLEGMYLVGRTENTVSAYIREASLGAELCYLDGITTMAYRPELAITLARRQWLFSVTQEWALVVDTIESELEHDYHLHLHASEAIETVDTGQFCFQGGNMPMLCKNPFVPDGPIGSLNVHCLGDGPLDYAIGPANMVYAYIFHVTQVKGGGMLTSDLRGGDKPPSVTRLICQATRGTRAQFLTVMSPHPVACRREGAALTISTPLGSRQVALDAAGLVMA
jgi:hypothetical protein